MNWVPKQADWLRHQQVIRRLMHDLNTFWDTPDLLRHLVNSYAFQQLPKLLQGDIYSLALATNLAMYERRDAIRARLQLELMDPG